MYSVGMFLHPTEWPEQTGVEVLYMQDSEEYMATGQSKILEQSILDGILAEYRRRRKAASADLSTAGAEGRLGSESARRKVLAVSDVDSVDGLPVRRRRHDRALVIGVESYALLGDADYASRDAGVFYKYAQTVLGVPEAGATILFDKGADAASVRAALDRLRRDVDPESRVWVFFAGHGGSDPSSGRPYLFPWDADPKNLAATGLSLDEIYKDLAAIPAGAVLAVFDTSFSGFGDRTWQEVNQRPFVIAELPDFPHSPRVSVLLAASNGETARAFEDRGTASSLTIFCALCAARRM
jgi:hypothetical protein